jgi:hypothetical protein
METVPPYFFHFLPSVVPTGHPCRTLLARMYVWGSSKRACVCVAPTPKILIFWQLKIVWSPESLASLTFNMHSGSIILSYVICTDFLSPAPSAFLVEIDVSPENVEGGPRCLWPNSWRKYVNSVLSWLVLMLLSPCVILRCIPSPTIDTTLF